MRALFDVNVLIALFDPAHIHHELAHDWLARHRETGWATCPITQNGCVRILSQPRYPNVIPVNEAIRRLRRAMAQEAHETWHDDLSVVDSRHFDGSKFLNARQITDLYLLALAVHHNGRLVTFDQGISMDPVVSAGPHHLVVL